MSLNKLQSGKREMALILLAPLLILGTLVFLGKLYLISLNQRLAARGACLEQMPITETQLVEARKVLKMFSEEDAEVDKASELTLVAEKAAQSFGFTTRMSNVEKQADTGFGLWSDYKVVLNGGGSLKSIIGMLDYLEHPARRCQSRQIVLKTNRVGAGALYDGNMIFAVRTVLATPPPENSSGFEVTTAQAVEQAQRLKELTDSVKSWLNGKQVQSVGVDSMKMAGEADAKPLNTSRLFVLHGIARDAKNPLAMTDRGVFGIGEKIDGYAIISISDDQVVLEDQGGHREVVQLY